MTTIALAAVKGAPGVSTLALALASTWPEPRQVTVVEADPDGGVLAARRMLTPEPGLVTLAAALRRDAATLSPHTQPIGVDASAVVAPVSAEQTRAALLTAGQRLARALDTADGDVVVDCGRLTPMSPAIDVACHADTTVLLIRPRAEDVAAVRVRIDAVRAAGVNPCLLLAADGPYTAAQVASAVDAPVIGHIPRDRRGAQALDEQTGAAVSARCALLRSARHIAEELLTRSAVGERQP